jgi:hypothetical protein
MAMLRVERVHAHRWERIQLQKRLLQLDQLGLRFVILFRAHQRSEVYQQTLKRHTVLLFYCKVCEGRSECSERRRRVGLLGLACVQPSAVALTPGVINKKNSELFWPEPHNYWWRALF